MVIDKDTFVTPEKGQKGRLDGAWGGRPQNERGDIQLCSRASVRKEFGET